MGKYAGIPTACPFCDWKPEDDHPDIEQWQKRRAQACHLALHVKGEV